MRAAGVSISRIVGAALKAGALLAVIAFLVGEGVAPVAEQKALQLRSEAQSGQVTLNTPYGFWARDGNAYVNIREILPGAYLRDVFIYELDDERRLKVATHADDARYVKKHWILDGISRSTISQERVEVSRVASAAWDSLLDPGLLDVVLVDPQALPVWGLFRYVRFMAENNQDAGPYGVALWSKVVQPFLVVAMIFLSIPILFGSARTAGMGARVFFGVMVGIGFYLVSRTFAYLAMVYGVSPFVAAVTPPLLFLATALWVMRRVG
jgi:lipopolysaccharide export system permease protein